MSTSGNNGTEQRVTWPIIRQRARTIHGVVYHDFVIDCGTTRGKRHVECRKTREEAEARAAELRRDRQHIGELALGLSADQKVDAIRALIILGDKATLETAALAYMQHARDTAMQRTVAQIQAELLDAQASRRNRSDSIAATRNKYASFVTQNAGVQITAVTIALCERWLAEQKFTSDSTRANVIRYLSTFFNFAVKRGYIARSPMVAVERPRLAHKVPEFIPTAATERLLRACQAHDQMLATKVAIGFFAGIRPQELARMQASDVDLAARVIHVRPEVAKCSIPRHVTISDNLLAWLKQYAFDTTNSFDERRKKVCAVAGIEAWPHDAMRHTFATMHVAAFQSPEKTAFEMGHIRGVGLLYRHYRGLVGRDEALRYWEIRP